MNKTREAIDNYVNGNLTDAKRLAKRLSWVRLVNMLVNEYGKTTSAAQVIAGYLKGHCSFQAACDADKSL